MFRFLTDDFKTQLTHSVVIALSAALLCFETLVLSGVERQQVFVMYFDLPAALFFITFFVYNFHHIGELQQKILGGYFEKTFLPFIIIITSVFSYRIFNQSYESGNSAVLILTGALAALFTYSYVFNRKLAEQIRQNFILKNSLLMLTYSIATVTVPLIYAGQNVFDAGNIYIFLRRMIFIGALVIPFEIRDMQKDAGHRHSNIANEFGIGFSKITAIFLLVLFSVLTLLQFGSKAFSGVLLLSAALSALLILLYQNRHRTGSVILLLTDTMMLMQAFLVLIVA